MDKERFVSVLVNQHGFSEEKAESMYETAIILIDNTKTVFNELVERMRELVGSIKEYFAEWEYLEPKVLWMPVLDTRQKSQVMLNKPRHLVRKII